jgi:hypothetical protein
MRRALGIALALALAGGIAFAAITWAALEGHEVAVLETRAADGTPRRTRVWVAEEGGAPWIEAGNPEREFYADLQRDPRVVLERDGRLVAVIAQPMPGGAGHAKIRGLLREKYGLADWWVGCLVDTSRSVAIRLDPVPVSG